MRNLPVDEYVSLILLGKPGEGDAAFKGRLSDLWTHCLREHEMLFEQVYAEMSAFEKDGDRLTRRYLIEADAAAAIAPVLRSQGMEFEPIDVADVYSKFEATPPDWFWIEH